MIDHAHDHSDASTMGSTSATDGTAGSWSRLWSQGVLHSCATGIQGNYDGPIRDFWQGRFAVVPNGGRILDIGTGNGALLLLAKDEGTARGVRFDLHGIDLADIDPPATVPGGVGLYSGITFHPRTPASRLPFPDGCASLVTSQYAFEYTSWQDSVAEFARVLAPGGMAALVIHSGDSVIARVADGQLRACAFLFEESRFFACARTVAAMLARATTAAARAALASDPEAEAARHRFNTEAGRLMDEIARRPQAEILRKAVQHVGIALREASSTPAAALQRLDDAEASLRDEHVRLRQLANAIMAIPDLHRVAAAFGAAGFVAIDLAPIDQHPGARMGWTLTARRG